MQIESSICFHPGLQSACGGVVITPGFSWTEVCTVQQNKQA